MQTDIHVENVGELQRDLSKLAEKLNKKDLVPILRPGAKVFQKAIKQRAPKRTGMLKRAVKVKVGKGKATAPYATLNTYFKNPVKPAGKKKGPQTYAYFIHNGVVQYGTSRNRRVGAHSEANRVKGLRQGGWRIKPEPFVYDAFEANVGQVADTILSKIESML